MNLEMVRQISSSGIAVFPSELAMAQVPAKKSKNKRLEKKFIKKYGMISKPGAIQTTFGLFVHPSIFEKLKTLSNK